MLMMLDYVVEWLTAAAEGLPASFGPSDLPCPAAVCEAWSQLRAALRDRGVHGGRGLCAWLVREGVETSVSPGAYLNRWTQEFVLQTAAASHPGVGALDGIYAAVTLHLARNPQRLGAGSLTRALGQGRRGPRDSQPQPPTPPPLTTQPGQGTRVASLWSLPPATWEAWSRIAANYEQWVQASVPTFRSVPACLQQRLAQTTQSIVEAIYAAPDEGAAERALLLLLGHHRLLLGAPVRQRVPGRPGGRAERQALNQERTSLIQDRLDCFEQGRWACLIEEVAALAAAAPAAAAASQPGEDEAAACAAAAALQLARAGEYRRAVQRLLSSGLAQGSVDELADALQAKFLRGNFPQAQPLDCPFLAPRRARPALLPLESFAQALRRAPRKTGAGASGSRLEFWQVLLQHPNALHEVHRLAEDLAHGCIPGGRLGQGASAFLLGSLTPLAKPAACGPSRCQGCWLKLLPASSRLASPKHSSPSSAPWAFQGGPRSPTRRPQLLQPCTLTTSFSSSTRPMPTTPSGAQLALARPPKTCPSLPAFGASATAAARGRPVTFFGAMGSAAECSRTRALTREMAWLLPCSLSE